MTATVYLAVDISMIYRCSDNYVHTSLLSQPCGLFLNQQELATLKHASD
ncbi:MAG: hypothetical protein HAW67_02850 [Endozoicomonadaceae bacterium]|nr:hypothetical protein [Endozoicomonadaceae bacterium]